MGLGDKPLFVWHSDDRLRPGPIECDDFARWPGAYAACETLSRGETLVNATAMVHTLTGLTLRPEHRWHFMQVGLPRLELKHGDLHTGSSVTARSCPAQRRPRPPCASASGWTARPPLAPSGPPSGRRGRGGDRRAHGHYTDYERRGLGSTSTAGGASGASRVARGATRRAVRWPTPLRSDGEG